MTLMNRLFPLIISLALVWFLLSRIELSDIQEVLAAVNPYVLIGLLFLYGGVYALRSLRFHLLLERRISIRDLFVVTCVHTLTNNILPARTGELSYVYLVKKYGLGSGHGIASLITARVLDLFVVASMFFLSSTMISKSTHGFQTLVMTITVGSALLVSLLTGIILLREKVLRAFNGLARLTHLEKLSSVQYLSRKLDETVDSFNQMTYENIIKASVLSLILWSISYVILYILSTELGIALRIHELIFTFALLTLSNVLPLRSVAGFGIVEGVWAFALINFNVPENTAIATGFGIHLLVLGYQIAFGIYGLIKAYPLLNREKK